jgi:exopolysaccharide production protein ExoY
LVVGSFFGGEWLRQQLPNEPMSEIVYAHEAPGRPRQRLRRLSADEILTEAMNILIALVALVFPAPVMLGVALAIFAQDGGPVVFAHRRIGRDGRYFYCLKFRSMAIDAEQRLADLLANDPVARAEWDRDHKLRNDPRVTKLGAFLRKTSLDELPQLFNVLNGTMSLVGPRPHPVVMRTEERLGDEIIAEYAHRHRVKPGITGWAQINGYRGATETAEQVRRRVEHDIYYIDNWSLLFDLRILLLTPLKVLFQRGNAF